MLKSFVIGFCTIYKAGLIEFLYAGNRCIFQRKLKYLLNGLVSQSNHPYFFMTLLDYRKPYFSWGLKDIIKMSSQLSLFSSSKCNEFNLKDIKVFVDSNKQPWFNWVHIGQDLVIASMYHNIDSKARIGGYESSACSAS